MKIARVEQETKKIKEKIKEELKDEPVRYNKIEKIADNVFIAFKDDIGTERVMGTLYRLRSTIIDNETKEELYALQTESGKWIFFSKRVHYYHDLTSEMDEKPLVELKPEINRVPLILLAILQTIFNIIFFVAMLEGIDLLELIGSMGIIGILMIAGWIAFIGSLFAIVIIRQNLLKGKKIALFIDAKYTDTISILEQKGLRKKEVIKNYNVEIWRTSLLYSDKASSRELRGFTSQDIAEKINKTLEAERQQFKRERDHLLEKQKELLKLNTKLARENDEMRGKLALMYTYGIADGRVRIGADLEEKETNWSFLKDILKWIVILAMIALGFNFVGGINIELGLGGLIIGGAIVIIVILFLLIIAINAARG